MRPLRLPLLALAIGVACACAGVPAPMPGVGETRGALGAATMDSAGADGAAAHAFRVVPLRPLAGDVELLTGHPDSAGRPFAMRIRELPGTIVPPHRHPVDEHLTVVSGTFWFGTGERWDSTALRRMDAGAYAFAPAGTTMFAWVPDGAVVQVHGTGPFHIHWKDGIRTLDDAGADSTFRFRRGDRVTGARGAGRVRQGYASGAVVQYEVERADGAAFMASAAELRAGDALAAPSSPALTEAQLAERHRREDERLRTDWAGLARYRAANAALGAPARGERRVVFMGNSIFEQWAPRFATDFAGRPYVGRGISGQTTAQLLVRFRQDVIALQPSAVVLLAGTNDVAENAGPATDAEIVGNVESMVQLARASGIRVVLCSILPAAAYRWRPALRPAARIVALNVKLKALAARHEATWVDLHSPLADAADGLRADYGDDGVHPNAAGYAVMAPLVEQGIRRALGAPARK